MNLAYPATPPPILLGFTNDPARQSFRGGHDAADSVRTLPLAMTLSLAMPSCLAATSSSRGLRLGLLSPPTHQSM